MSNIESESASASAKYADSERQEPQKGVAVKPRAEDEAYSLAESEETQAGVKRIEAVSENWTKWGLVIAYVSYDSISLRKERLSCSRFA